MNELTVVLDELVADSLLGISGPRAETWHTMDYVADQVKAIKIVHHAHVERSTGRTLLFVATHVQVRMASSPVSQSVNEPRITVKREDDRLVRCE